MANEQFAGLLQQLGLPSLSEEELVRQRTAQRVMGTIANTTAAGRPLIERDAYKFGNRAGAALGGLLSPAKVGPKEKSQIEAAAAAAAKYEQDKVDNPEKYTDPSRDLLSYQKFLAEELIKTGDPENVAKGAQLYSVGEQQRKAVKKQDMALEELGLVIDGKKVQNEARLFDLDKDRLKWKRGEIHPIWPRGAKYGDQPIDAYRSEQDGSANWVDQNGKPQRLAIGQYTAYPPVKPASAGGSRVTGASKVGASERQAIRNLTTSTVRSVDRAVTMKRIIEDNIISTDGTVNLLGPQGALNQGVVKLVDTMQGVARQLKSTLTIEDGAGKNRNLAKKGAATAYVKANYDELSDTLEDLMPATARATADSREQWMAAAVQLTYARALINEPGAQRLSDEDFKRALQSTAAMTTNPETFRKVTYENALQDFQSLEDAYAALPDDLSLEGVVGSAMQKRVEEARNTIELEFGDQREFGTAPEPGPGLDRAPPPSLEEVINFWTTE